jgi:hypothetical protein
MKKAPTTKKRKGMKIQGVEPDKKSSYTDKKGKTVELKRYKSKEYKRTTDPDATKETRRATRRTNTLELSKTKTKKDGTTKTKVKRAAGGTKKAERLTGQFKKGARKEGASDVKIERKSIAKMKKSPSKMKSPAKKPLVGKQKNLPDHLKKAILDAPAKMLSKSGMKMMKEGSPAKLKLKDAKKAVRKGKMTPDDAGAKGLGYGKDYDKLVKSRAYKKQRADEKGYKSVRKAKKAAKANDGFLPDSPAKMKTPMKKSKKKVEQDYARNAIADYKAGKKKQGNYEKKKALELAAGESGVMMKKSPAAIKKTQKKKKTYYSSPESKPGGKSYHDQASKTVSTQKGRYTKGKTKTKFVNDDSPYSGKKQTLTKTKTVNKGYGPGGKMTTKETQKAISPKRADRMRSRFRKEMASESPGMMKNPMMMKSNQDGGAYAAKNPAAPARQLKKLGSILSKHMKSK